MGNRRHFEFLAKVAHALAFKVKFATLTYAPYDKLSCCQQFHRRHLSAAHPSVGQLRQSELTFEEMGSDPNCDMGRAVGKHPLKMAPGYYCAKGSELQSNPQSVPVKWRAWAVGLTTSAIVTLMLCDMPISLATKWNLGFGAAVAADMSDGWIETGQLESILLQNASFTPSFVGWLLASVSLMGATLIKRPLQAFFSKVSKREPDENARVSSAEGETLRTTKHLEQQAQLGRDHTTEMVGHFEWDVLKRVYVEASEAHCAAFGMSPTEFIDQTRHRGLGECLVAQADQLVVQRNNEDLFKGNLTQRSYQTDKRNGSRWLLEIVRPVRDEAGRIVRVQGTSIDITTHKAAELKLRETNRLDTIGHLTGGIAHDFNNLLAVILGNLELAKLGDLPEDSASLLDEALDATLRGRDLIRSMLSYARRAPLSIADLNVNYVIQEMLPILRRSIPENIDIRVDLKRKSLMVKTDRSMIESVLMNLCVNAKDAMPQGGTLTIETDVVLQHGRGDHKLAVDPTLSKDTLAAGNYIVLRVADTGVGIEESEFKTIFQPFQSSKSPATNSGLGLSLLHGFARQIGGAVQVQSKVGAGSTFELLVPSIEQSSWHASVDDEIDLTHPAIAGKSVLLVEDDELLLSVMARILTNAGMEVKSAVNARDGRDIFLSKKDTDVLIVDMVMPGEVQGSELAAELNALRPDLSTVYMSGYSDQNEINHEISRTGGVTLSKPFKTDELISAVSSCLLQKMAVHSKVGQSNPLKSPNDDDCSILRPNVMN